MADRSVSALLIGGGIASATAAEALREGGYSGSILLATRELDRPYHRPPITKGYLQGKESREDGMIDLPGDVEVMTRTSVMSVDDSERVAVLSTKETVEFEHAILATGAMVRRLNLDGAEKDGIHYLRAPGNADALREDIADLEEIVLVGGSYIGCEVASSLTVLGKRCTILMLEDDPFDRHFGGAAGAFFRRVLEEHGITVRGGVDVEAFVGDGERVEGVRLAGGELVAGQAVVVGVGAQPDAMLARKSGLPIGGTGGVTCDSRLRVGGEGPLYAAGDICEYDSVVHGRPLRVEHEEHAAAQGRTVAANILGADKPHDDVPYFFSDLADWVGLEYVGPALDWASEEVVGSMDSGEFGISYLDAEGRTLAHLSVNGGGDIDAATEQIKARAAA